MIGLDTNVLVRYVVQDDPAQSAAATQLIESLTEDEPGFVSLPVLVEVFWVLTRSYRATRESVTSVVLGLVHGSEVVVDRTDVVLRALRRGSSGADFADALISELGAETGCRTTVTFDVRAARTAGMELLHATP